MFLSLACLLLLFLKSSVTLKFENITNEVFPINSGIIAAFGHFNSDEYTDVFTLQQGGNKLQILLWSKTAQQFQQHLNCTFESVITGVVPGDFDGDSIMDVLITLTSASDPSMRDVRILWGNANNYVNCSSSTLFSIVNQPLVVDFNGDMIPDVIAEARNGTRHVWFSSKEKKFMNKPLQSNQTFANPHSSGLIDINDDLAADILIMGENYIEIWINTFGEYNFSKDSIIPYPKLASNHIRLQSTFIDLNLDAKLDLIMPVCHDLKCEHSEILLLNKSSSKWEVLLNSNSFKHDDLIWGFKVPKGSPLDMAALPATLRAGDVDMDGYPDFLTILETKSKHSVSRPVIIKNQPCLNCTHCVLDRCLVIIWDIPGLQGISNIEIAAFFDIYEDGILDIIASSKNLEWKIHVLKNSENLDSYFMKVLVLSGLSDSWSFGQMPYGVNQPGPIVKYTIKRQDGHPLMSSAIQISQTAYFPLHLPYSVFGLGETPNFIDFLKIAVPAKFNKTVHSREWTQLIPNSQIVVIPHPPKDESKWEKMLFVTPSHYVLLTLIALIGTMIFISVIVAVLHWRERKEDKKEKMQDAYRFHFDAM